MATSYQDYMNGNTGVTGGLYRTYQTPGIVPSGSGATTQGASQDTNGAGSASDPFGYTMGSLLTPWTKPFSYTPPAEAPESGGGGDSGPGAPPPPSFAYPDFNYSFRDPGAYQAPSAFQAPAAPFTYQGFTPGQASFTGDRLAQPGAFQAPVSPYQQAAYQQGQGFQPTAAFTADRFTGPAQYQAPGAFTAPTVTDDPGYQFRLQQGQQALENSAAAKGILRTGGTMKDLIDYGQNAASQEYQNAYNRALGAYQTNADVGMAAYDRQLQGATAAYDRNYNAGLTENQTAYDRAASEYDRSQQNNANAWQMNFNAGMAQNEQAYNRGASEYDRTQQNQMAVNQQNYARASSEYDRNYANELQRYQMGYGNAASEYDRNFQNAANAYQLNAQTGLGAYQANVQGAQAMGSLGLDAATAAYDRNFNVYQTAFGIDESRRQQAAALAAAGSGGGGGLTDQQSYNRALQQYQMEYGIFQDNQNTQFNRLATLAQLGQGSANAVGSYGSNYGANAGNLLTGMGNSAAAGVVGGANAYNQALGGASNAGMSLGMLAMMNAQQQNTMPAFNYQG